MRGRVAAGGRTPQVAWVPPSGAWQLTGVPEPAPLGAWARKGPAGVGPQGKRLRFIPWKKSKPGLATFSAVKQL